MKFVNGEIVRISNHEHTRNNELCQFFEIPDYSGHGDKKKCHLKSRSGITIFTDKSNIVSTNICQEQFLKGAQE